jgi:hypothetical protein
MVPPFDTLDGLDLVAFAALGGIALILRWMFAKSHKDWTMPDPQHDRRLELRRPPYGVLGVGSAPRYVVRGKPTWEFPPARDNDYEDGTSPVVEEGRDQFRRWLLGETRTAFTR